MERFLSTWTYIELVLAIIFKIFVDKYNLEPSECVFIDDRADNIEASIRAGMSGIVFKDIEQVLLELDNILGTELEI